MVFLENMSIVALGTIKAMQQMSHIVPYGVIIDPVYRILVDSSGNEVTRAQRCGY